MLVRIWRKGNLFSFPLVGIKTGVATMENSMEVPQEMWNRTIWPSNNSTSEYLSKGSEITISKRCLHSYVHCSIIFNKENIIYYMYIHTHICMHAKLLQLCPTLCNCSDCMDCSPPGSSVQEILQARILEWVAMLFSRRASWPRN